MTEQTTAIGIISGEAIFNEGEKFKNNIRLVLTQDNIFTGVSEEIDVKITETEDKDSTEYRKDKLEKAFKVISDQTGIDLEVPEKINKTNIKKALKEVAGKELTVFVGEAERVNDDGDINETVRYYSLYESFENDYVRANATIAELLEFDDTINPKKSILVKPVDFAFDNNTQYFQSGKPFDAEMVEDTTTRKGLGQVLFKILKSDEGETSKELQAKLTDYMKKNTDKDGNFGGTTSGVLKSVGVFTEKSPFVGDLEDVTIMRLEQLLSSERKKGRAYTGSLRLLFNAKNVPIDKIFKTHKLKEAPYNKKGETLCATFNPKDTNFKEFAKFVQPLYEIGALSQDDFKEIQGMTQWYDIKNKILDVVKRENVYARISLLTSGENYSASLLAFEYPSDADLVDESVAKAEPKEADEKTDEVVESKPQATSKAPKEADEETDENPFKNGVGSDDDPEDDLPF